MKWHQAHEQQEQLQQEDVHPSINTIIPLPLCRSGAKPEVPTSCSRCGTTSWTLQFTTRTSKAVLASKMPCPPGHQDPMQQASTQAPPSPRDTTASAASTMPIVLRTREETSSGSDAPADAAVPTHMFVNGFTRPSPQALRVARPRRAPPGSSDDNVEAKTPAGYTYIYIYGSTRS